MEEAEDAVAVIGIGCNFPGGEGLDNFWRVLLKGKNCTVDIPKQRFDTTFWYNADDCTPGRTQTTKAALVEGINDFDHKFFGISEVEAEFMDPQQKLLLQCTYRALEDAGISMESISGSRTGVYIGLMNRDYEMLRSNNSTKINHYNGTGTAMSMAANKISFTFNLTGPSVAIDTACSSSLVAVHLACQAIKQGDCETAVCGGVSCILEPRVFIALSKAKMISPEGTSKPFSRSADGYGRGEGCGVLILKPLKNAIKDYNKIWGTVSKTAVNQDGHYAAPITRPSMIQQQDLLKRIYSESDILNVQYIEAHGTGTRIGDPTEAESISSMIAKAKPPGSEVLRVGSVKGNIGHTESAAGVAGLIKVLLMLKHKTIVPTVFYSDDSASVDVKDLRINIPTTAERWDTNGSLGRRAGINSFGFGGTNAHVIVKEYKQINSTEKIPKGCPKLFVISAASEKSFIQTLANTKQRLLIDQSVDLQALSYTSACGRSHSRHKYRRALTFDSLTDLDDQLKNALKTKAESTRFDLQLVFVFCGSGVAYRGMCKRLLSEFAVFRDKVKEVDRLFQRYASISICQWLWGDSDHEDFNKPNISHSLLFAVQVGIAALLQEWGIRPDVVLGHSVGEVAAAHCSGLLSLEDAVKVLHHRSAAQSKVTGGKMLVVSNVAVGQVLDILPSFSGKVCVAAFNSPQSCTLSGDADTIHLLHQRLKSVFAEERVLLHELDVPAAYHSHMMDPILEDTERSIGHLDSNKKKCGLYSTVTGGRHSDGEFTTGSYWVKNIREPVLFEQTLHAVTESKKPSKDVVFVEIGPRKAMQRSIRETLGNNTVVLPSVQTERDYDTILSTTARLFQLGINVDWHQLYRGFGMLPTALPVYQFDNTKQEIDFEAMRKCEDSIDFSHRGFISPIKRDGKEYRCNLSPATAPYLWEHKNNGVPIVPGAFYVQLAYAAVMASLRPQKPVSLLQLAVSFESLFTLSSNSHQLTVKLEQGETEASFKIQSAVAKHASGSYRCSDRQTLLEEPTFCLDVIFQRCKMVMKKEEIYSVLSQAGFEYGSIFKQLDDVHYGVEFKEALTAIKVPHELLKHLHEYFIHPVLLDYFLQMTAVVAIGQLTAKQGFPSAIGSVTISGPIAEEMFMYLRVTQETTDFLEVCGSFSTPEGRGLVELRQVRISFLGMCSGAPQSWFFSNEVTEMPNKTDLKTSLIKAIVFEDKFGIARGLRPYLLSESTLVKSRDTWTQGQVENVVLCSLNNNPDLENVLFICGAEDLSDFSSDKMLDRLVTCCELLRQVVLALKESKRSCTVRVITYRSSEKMVDHISAGFVLSGLTRACAAEIAGLSFQLIDLASVGSEDIQMLVHVINSCKEQEVMISKGQVSTTRIARTSLMDQSLSADDLNLADLSDFALQTTDPYRTARLTAIPRNTSANLVPQGSVEIQLTSVCVHSSDYFPVTTSHLNYGRTIYWNKHVTQNHELLALDFSGVVTRVGKHVDNVRIGDHVAACYPVSATAKVIIPEAVCYSAERFPFLSENPCVSFFIVAWEILQNKLSEFKQQNKKLVIVSSTPAAALTKVVALTANRSGWTVSSVPQFREGPQSLDRSHAFVVLPPFSFSWQQMNEIQGHDRHVIFVCYDQMSSSLQVNMLALKSGHTHVHTLDVTDVLQKANLQAQTRNISNWLMSLGFGSVSLPLKREIFQQSQAEEAQAESYFTSTSVQQVVLDKRESDKSQVSDISLQKRPEELFKQFCVYIVTGGLSGLGLETVKFIARFGGGYIVTLSRRTLTEQMQLQIDILQTTHAVTVLHVQCDVSVSSQVEDAFSKIMQRFPGCPIKGVFHSAAVLHDGLIETLDRSLFLKVLQPKVSGALNLHYATLQHKLDYFVCFSSISSFIGNASQCNYAAANSFLDTFCHYRRNLGLAGQSINWGPLNLGLLLNKDHFQRFLETKGMRIMDVRDVQDSLEKCLLMNQPQQVICKFNFKNLKIHVLSQNVSLRERLSALVETELKDEVSDEPGLQYLSSTHVSLKTIISDIIDVSIDELKDDSALCDLGIDSMLAMTLQNKIFQDTGVNVPLVRILDPHSTVSSLEAILENSSSRTK